MKTVLSACLVYLAWAVWSVAYTMDTEARKRMALRFMAIGRVVVTCAMFAGYLVGLLAFWWGLAWLTSYVAQGGSSDGDFLVFSVPLWALGLASLLQVLGWTKQVEAAKDSLISLFEVFMGKIDPEKAAEKQEREEREEYPAKNWHG